MDGSASAGRLSNTRLYGAAIAVVSGGYSILSVSAGWGTMAGTGMTAGAWVMFAVGIAALLHGIALLTPAADRLGTWSGPAMIAYAVVMLLNRAILPMGTDASGAGPGMVSGGMMGGAVGPMDPAGGPGMIALALLMLLSGLVMTVRGEGRA